METSGLVYPSCYGYDGPMIGSGSMHKCRPRELELSVSADEILILVHYMHAVADVQREIVAGLILPMLLDLLYL